MTNREFFTAIAANTELSEELREHAQSAIAKMEASIEKRKGAVPKKVQEKRDADEVLARYIATNMLGYEPMTATDVAAALTIYLGLHDADGNMTVVTTQRASALCRKAVQMGLASQMDIKVPKRGTVKGYVTFES